MTAKEFLKKRWWLVALIGLLIIGAVTSESGKNLSSDGSSSKKKGDKIEYCAECGNPFEHKTGYSFRKPADPNAGDYSAFQFCSIACQRLFAKEHGFNVNY